MLSGMNCSAPIYQGIPVPSAAADGTGATVECAIVYVGPYGGMRGSAKLEIRNRKLVPLTGH